jgi:hypothetical protein
MLTREQLEPLSKDELIEIILKLDAQVHELRGRVATLEAQLREAHSAKAPFGKGKRKSAPKPPGRRPGEGKFSRRNEPVAGPNDVVEHLDAPFQIRVKNITMAHYSSFGIWLLLTFVIALVIGSGMLLLGLSDLFLTPLFVVIMMISLHLWGNR